MFSRITALVFCLLFVRDTSEAATSDPQDRSYTLQPLGAAEWGAEIQDLLLTDFIKNPDNNTVNKLEADVREYQALLLRNQGLLGPYEQVNLTNLFKGGLNCIHDDHPLSPHRCIIRFANDPELGLARRGKRWHIDGGQRVIVDDIVIYQMVSVAKEGRTVFLPMRLCAKLLTPEQRNKFERLWYITVTNDIFPYMVTHPFTGDVIFRPHYYNFRTFIWDYGTENERKVTDRNEKNAIFNEMLSLFEDTCRHLWYQHEWKEGDILITDNMALAHRATEEAYKKPSEIGERILHRTSTLSSRIAQPLRGPQVVEKNEQTEKVKDEL